MYFIYKSIYYLTISPQNEFSIIPHDFIYSFNTDNLKDTKPHIGLIERHNTDHIKLYSFKFYNAFILWDLLAWITNTNENDKLLLKQQNR